VRGWRPAFNLGTPEEVFGDVDDVHRFSHITTPIRKACNTSAEAKLHFLNLIPHKCSSSHFVTT